MLKEYFNTLMDGDMLMKDRQGFGSRIREMREHQNLTIEKAAELCNHSESTWKQYERGEGLPSVLKLKNICLALKGKPEYIYGSEFFCMEKEHALITWCDSPIACRFYSELEII